MAKVDGAGLGGPLNAAEERLPPAPRRRGLEASAAWIEGGDQPDPATPFEEGPEVEASRTRDPAHVNGAVAPPRAAFEPAALAPIDEIARAALPLSGSCPDGGRGD